MRGDMTQAKRYGYRMLLRRAQHTAEICGKCGRALDPQEPVWRTFISNGPPFFRYSILPLCGDRCRAVISWRRYLPERPCEGCGRGVFNQTNGRSHKHAFCCQQCQRDYYSARQREKRVKARQKVCELCGKDFVAARRDALTCSPACRQKAYRQRPQTTGAASL